MKFTKKIFLYSILGILAGFSSFGFVVLVNTTIDLLVKDNFPRENNLVLYFALTILLFFLSRRILSQGIIELSQNIFWSLRNDIVMAIVKASYPKVRELKEEIYSALTADVNNITSASVIVVGFITSIILVIASFIYLGYLSLTLFSLSIFCIGVGVVIYLKSSRTSHHQFTKVRNLEKDFMKGFNSILEGNREIKINPRKGFDILRSTISPVIAEGEKRNVVAYIGYLNSQLISQMLFYLIIMIILVIVGNYISIDLGTIISFVFALLYLLGPIVNIMLNIPILNRALISYNKLKFIKNELEFKNETKVDEVKILKEGEGFETIAFQGYEYAYPSSDPFSIGPINLEIKANEIIFIYGGNGSGKTTFINTILTLYSPDKGKLVINDKEIHKEELEQSRALFSPIFSDFYLFDNFYGIKSIDESRVEQLLKLFEIEHKVSYKNNKLSTTDLSTGQSKRLALIGAILEDRPILVLDEWAADQDPSFRKKFYTEIIHYISEKENKTIIAITHDDYYYQEADRLFKMVYGKLEEKFSSISLTKKY